MIGWPIVTFGPNLWTTMLLNGTVSTKSKMTQTISTRTKQKHIDKNTIQFRMINMFS